ncbi:MAG: histidinol dehydrogenase, partial [Coriobacteriales bacterium]|nr:histidinol dehydrogenase [Coriobacteriales bacterium]
MRTIKLEGTERLTTAHLRRTGALPREVTDAAIAIVEDVRARGDKAVRECTLRFDGACPDTFRVPDEVVQGALDMVDPAFLESLKQAHRQIRDFHEREVEQSWFT